MNRIFIDTNILVSAIVFDGNELDVILTSIKREDQVFISEHIIEEATRVFMKKFPEYLELFDSFIELSGIEIIEKSKSSDKISSIKNIRDKYDAHVIACAERVECNYIISGDKDLLSYHHKTIKIQKSREYLSFHHQNIPGS